MLFRGNRQSRPLNPHDPHCNVGRQSPHQCNAGSGQPWARRGNELRGFLNGLNRRVSATVLLLAAMTMLVAGCQSVDVAHFAPLSSKYSALVVNADTGKVVHEASADAVRYPASLTKMMTLYLLFEAIESGRVTLETQIPVSGNASRQPPSKIGIKAGQSISVDTAIRALAVKSANDVAYAVGEYLAGSESAFASLMTARAREIGLTRTQFRNASGLPDPGQYTTARDMARLGILLRKRFPAYYPYFSLKSFTYGGREIRGHNKLLAERGVDGIKTGYIRASGYNVVTSVNRYSKHYVVVVMGGDSGRERDLRVRELIAAHAR